MVPCTPVSMATGTNTWVLNSWLYLVLFGCCSCFFGCVHHVSVCVCTRICHRNVPSSVVKVGGAGVLSPLTSILSPPPTSILRPSTSVLSLWPWQNMQSVNLSHCASGFSSHLQGNWRQLTGITKTPRALPWSKPWHVSCWDAACLSVELNVKEDF